MVYRTGNAGPEAAEYGRRRASSQTENTHYDEEKIPPMGRWVCWVKIQLLPLTLRLNDVRKGNIHYRFSGEKKNKPTASPW